MYQVIKIDGGYISVRGDVQFFSSKYAADKHAEDHNKRNLDDRKHAIKQEGKNTGAWYNRDPNGPVNL